MKIMTSAEKTEIVVITLEPGELLLESIQMAVNQTNIRNGMIVSAIGTLKTLNAYYITRTECPPVHKQYHVEKPMEVMSINGVIADGSPHLHIVASSGQHEVYCGHLLAGCEVAYLAEIAILQCNRLKLERRVDDRGINLLGPS